MNAFIPAALALVALLTFTPAMADNHSADAAAPATEAAVDAAAAPAEAPAPVEYTLKDGTTKVVVEGENVFVVAADGAKVPAPDGDHETTTEGVTLKVKEGKLVKEEAATEAAPATEAVEEKAAE